MPELPDNLKQDLMKLIPPSVYKELACFVFYDRHPSDTRNLIVTVCTSKGEVFEIFQREIVSSLLLKTKLKPTEIILHRNRKCDIHYVISAGSDLYILSSKQILQCRHKISRVKEFMIHDFDCKGEPYLKVICSDDAMPVNFNQDFDIVAYDLNTTNLMDCEANLPIINHLNTKLTLARYNYAMNMKALDNMRILRQKAVLALYQSIHPYINDSALSDLRQFSSDLRIKTWLPWMKACNKKIVLAIQLCNENTELLEEVHALLHCKNINSLEHTSKIFHEINEVAYWKENENHNIRNQQPVSLVIIIDMNELKHTITSKVEFGGMILYKINKKEKILPFEEVSVTALQVMDGKFDVFANEHFDKNDMLAILSTSKQINLVCRRIQDEKSENVSLPELIRNSLNMENVCGDANVLVHRMSPYHQLHGVMVVFSDVGLGNSCHMGMTVYFRNEAQVLSLIRYINDAVPERIVITSPDQKLTPLHPDIELHDVKLESIHTDNEQLRKIANSLIHQIDTVKNYYDKCIATMSKSKSSDVLNKIGVDIDVFAAGKEVFDKLNEDLQKEMDNINADVHMLGRST